MKEQLISFDTAKLAKDKGFKGDVTHFYELDTIGNNQLLKLPIIPHDHQQEVFQAPTQSLLQKWLREVHNTPIWVKAHLESETKEIIYWVQGIGYDGSWTSTYWFKTYEEALEKGLQESLKLIK